MRKKTAGVAAETVLSLIDCTDCTGDGHEVLCMWSMARAFRWSIAYLSKDLHKDRDLSFLCCEVFPYDLATKLIFDLNGVVCCWGDRTGPEGGKHWIFLAWLSVKVTHWGPEGDASKHLPSESLCQGSHCGPTGVGSCGCTYISVPRNHQYKREEGTPRSWFHFSSFLTRKCS